MVRDRRFTAAHLAVLAHRVTYGDDRGAASIVPAAVAKMVRGYGLGPKVLKKVVRDLVSWGYLDRHQPPPVRKSDGTYKSQRAIDKLALPDGPSIVVRRSWMDGRCTLDEFGALIYMLAGTGEGPEVYRRELRERFDWGVETTRKVIAGLVDLGLVSPMIARRPDGTIRSHAYAANRKKINAAIQRMHPGDGQQPRRSQPVRLRPRIRRSPSTDSPLNEPIHGIYCARARPEASVDITLPPAEPKIRSSASPTNAAPKPFLKDSPAAPPRPKEDDNPYSSPYLLGWVEQDSLTGAFFGLDAVPEDLIEAMWAAFPDDAALVGMVRTAAEKRVNRRLLTAGGMSALRYMAAAIMAHVRSADERPDDDCHASVNPHGAVRVILRALRDRWGNRPDQWLNSYWALGKRLAGQMSTLGIDTDSISAVYRPLPVTDDDLSGDGGKALQALIEAGGYIVLAPELRDGPGAIRGLHAFLSAEAVRRGCRRLDVFIAVLRALRRSANAGAWTIGGRQNELASRWEVFRGVTTENAKAWKKAS